MENQGVLRFIFSRAGLGYIAWLQALIAMLGSLMFSEIMYYPPCNLCWYQRIAMYPLVLILGIGVFNRDRRVRQYALGLAGIGWLISAYHNLMTYTSLIPEGSCGVGDAVSCSVRWVNWYGFITIPLMALVAFTVIIVCMVLYKPADVAQDAE
jgi:disulfide bond formation protein DsbB